MNLDYFYELNEKEIIDEINRKEKESGKLIFKMAGYRYLEGLNHEKKMLAWQSMNVNFGVAKVNTHILLRLVLDENDTITDIELYNDFKGSQGIKCKHEVLNDHIKKTFINEKLSLRNYKIKNVKNSWCRHIYELLYGMTDFYNYSIKERRKNTFYFEENYVEIGINKFSIVNEINFNTQKHKVKITLLNLNKAKLNRQTMKIDETNPLEILAQYDEHIIPLNKEIYANNNTEFYQGLMKACEKIWHEINIKMNLDDIYSFSILWPTTIFSYIVQILTIYISKGKNNALNRCLENFQKKDENALCIGFLDDRGTMNDEL